MNYPIPPDAKVVLSPSRAKAFTQCARRYAFRYELGLKEPPTEATERGTAVHMALEVFYSLPRESRLLPALDAALEVIVQEFEHPELINPTEVEALARNIFKVEDPTKVQVIGTEYDLGELVGGYHLRGIIDRADREPDGTITLVDYKTGRIPSKRDEHEALRALMLYAKLWEEVHGERVNRVKLIYLRGTEKRGNPIVVAENVTDGGVAFAAKRLAAIGDAIGAARAAGGFRPNPTPLCQWCPFRASCPEGDRYLLDRGK